jgi:type IV pilus assembly protein PilE
MNPKHAFSPAPLRGYSLIEILVVVAIVGILAAIALPSYSAYIIRGKRAEGRAALHDLAAREERFYSDNNSQYTGTIGAGGINLSAQEQQSTDYTFSALVPVPPDISNQTYLLTATPAFTDTKCGSFTLDQTGTRGITIAGVPDLVQSDINDCWGR